MQLFAGIDQLHFTAVLVTRSSPIRLAVAQIAESTGIRLVSEADVSAATGVLARERVPVILLATDVPWREVIRSLASYAVRPSVIVLMPGADPNLWAEALKLGAFDALPMCGDGETLAHSMAAAYCRWERSELVRGALARNPFSRRSA